MKTILKRVERLEKAVIPPEPWRITVEYTTDGHTETMTAKRFREVKEKYLHDVHGVDRVVSGNLAELDDWLRTVAFVASHVAHDDEGQYIPDDITELDIWLKMDAEKAVTPI